MSLQCHYCPTPCCGFNKVKPPILLPHELQQFYGGDVYTENGRIFRLRRDASGGCMFLTNDRRCRIYETRPMECRLYPYIMNWDATTKKITLELHWGCPQLLAADMPAIPDEVNLVSEEFWIDFMKEPI